MDNVSEVGGLPWGFLLLKPLLLKNKQTLHKVGTAITMMVTYLTYMAFVTARVPMIITEVKVIEKCEPVYGGYGDENITTYFTTEWCNKYGKFEIPEYTFALLGTIYSFAYALSLHVSGCFSDYTNSRYYLFNGCMFSSFLVGLFSLIAWWKVWNIEYMVVLMTLLGAAQSTAWPIVLSCCAYWYAGSRMGLVFGIWNSHLIVGRIIGVFLVYNFNEDDWRFSFTHSGILLGIMGFVVLLFLVAHPFDLKKLHEDKSKSAKKENDPNAPSWLDSWATLDYSDAFRVPGVLEYCYCMFFARMTHDGCTFWLPKLRVPLAKHPSVFGAMATASLPYMLGGIVGGVSCGVLKDIYNKSALICFCFFLASMPVTALHVLEPRLFNTMVLRILIDFVLGATVMGPYILLVTSIAFDLSRHPIIRRGHRGIATIAAIIESAGSMGSTVIPFINYALFRSSIPFGSAFQIILLMEMGAGICLLRLAWNDYNTRNEDVSARDYFLSPSWKRVSV